MVTIKEYLKTCEKVISAGKKVSSEQMVGYIEIQTELVERMNRAIRLAERALERATHFLPNEGQQALLKEALDDIRELRG